MTFVLLLVLLLAGPASAAAQGADSTSALRAMEEAFTSVAYRVMPAVVTISAGPHKGPAAPGEPAPLPPGRFRQFFGPELDDRFPRRSPREDSRASGTGVLVDPAGYILTNDHVIAEGAEITVRLFDGRTYRARVLGRDPKTDLAVLKVEAEAPLPAAELGDSDRLRVGQWAIAIGNPFGLERTVTVGIVSATARTHVGVAAYESFIQTDASINPGNSGGPLLNLDGQVVGINTAILATGQGIGFSIPVNMAKEVMRQLITRGRVVRGWLGVAIQDVTDDLAASFGVNAHEGVLVTDIVGAGPADVAGLRPGDVITELDGARVTEVPDLQQRVAAVAPGKAVRLRIVRDRMSLAVRVTLGELPSDDAVVLATGAEDWWGISVAPVGPGVAGWLDVERGVVVTEVEPAGPAAAAGLRPGDVVLNVNREPVADLTSFRQLLAAVPAGQAVRLYVHRAREGGLKEYLVLERPAP